MAVYEATVTVAFDVYVRRSGAWSKVGQIIGSYYNRKGTAASAGYNTSVTNNIQLGTGVEAFGVTAASVDGGTVATTRLDQVQWNAAGAPSSVRSALPNGGTTVVTVRPK